MVSKWMMAAILVVAATRPSRASLLVYEGFNYGPQGSQVLGNNGGTGFSTPWQASGAPTSTSANYVLNSGGLSFGQLLTTGQSASSPSLNAFTGLVRSFNQTFGADNTTLYMSFLVRPEGTLNEGASFGYFGLYLDSNADHLFVGKPGGGNINDYALERQGGSFQTSSGTAAVANQTAFLVVRADFLPGADTFTLYVNPTPGGLEPLTGTVNTSLSAGTITGLELFSSGAFSIDEIRIGDTFADVTPTPEPSTSVLVALAFTTLVILKARCTGDVRRSGERSRF